MIFRSEYLGEKAITLENDSVCCIVLPKHGGKFVSMKFEEFEFLFQNPKKRFEKANLKSRFCDFEACGFDDAFPSIDRDEVVLHNGENVCYPDHGEIWSSDLSYDIRDNTVHLEMDSRVLPYHYEKDIQLSENAIIVSYCIRNTGTVEFPYIWAFHCLVNYEEDMELIYPQGVHYFENVLYSLPLGNAGNIYKLSKEDRNHYDFQKVPKSETNLMEKYYIHGKVPQGECGYYYPREHMKVKISYDHKKLPYLGFWITTGGFRGDKNCAFEPTTGYYDSIAKAEERGCCSYLKPKETFTFDLKIEFCNNGIL